MCVCVCVYKHLFAFSSVLLLYFGKGINDDDWPSLTRYKDEVCMDMCGKCALRGAKLPFSYSSKPCVIVEGVKSAQLATQPENE